MADISNIKFNNVEYDIMDAAARAGFAYASVVTTNNDGDWQTRLVFYRDSAKTKELGSFDISGINLEGLFAKQVMAGEGVLTPVINIDNPEDGIADSTYIIVKKVNGKPVFVFSSTADGTLGTAKTEVTLPVGTSGEVALKSQVDAVASDLAALVGTGNVSAAIDSFNEIVTFLNGIDKTDPTLANQLLGINDRIDAIDAVSGTVDDALSDTSTKPVQNKVIKGALDSIGSDINTLSGEVVHTISVNGGSATSPTNGNINITIPSAAWADVKPSGGVSKSDLATGVQTSLGKADSAIQGVKVNGTELTPDANKKVDVTVPTKLSDLAADATHRVVTDAEKSTWSGKQSAINDLDTIRSGAGKGATSVQTISVNGASLSPTDGNISISAVTGLQFDGSSHVGAVQLPEYVKKSDYDTTIDDIYQSIPSDLADMVDDATHRLVTDTEKNTWNGKQNAISDLATIRSGAAAGATAYQKPSGGIPASDIASGVIPDTSGMLTKSDVSVETQGDGTVDFNVADDTYKINLNHTHENMAKLVVCVESDLPSTLEMDTIYAQVDNATDPTEIQSLWIAGLEFVGGGGDPEPRLRFPTNGSQINLDDLTSGGLFIRGYNLSQPLLVTVTGDFTINGGSTATVQATDANAGTTLTLACTTQSYNATGSLVITSSEGINTSCSLIANVPNYESITAAVFSGAQWVNMGFSVGPNTSFEWDVQFAEDSQHAGSNTTFFSCNSDRPSLFQANFATGSFNSMYFWVGESYVQKGGFSLGRGVFRYANQDCSYRGVTLSPPEVTSTASDFSLGVYRVSGEIYNHTRMIVFGLKVYENNVLTHDFVPKKFGSVVGFYDNLTGAFVSSQTSTELEEYNS